MDHKKIQTVGDASKRLEEDALRILRAIRFASQLNFQLEDSLFKAILEKRDLVKELSAKRILKELDQIEKSEFSDYGKYLLEVTGLYKIITKKIEKHIQ